MADVCRCHLPIDPPDDTGPHRWPAREPEPAATVRAVALVGQDPIFLRAERDGAGWRTAGHAAAHPGCVPARLWRELGVCWAGTSHAVIDVTSRRQAAGR